MTSVLDELTAIDLALQEGRYKPGPWHRVTTTVQTLPSAERREMSERISDTGDKLHRRHAFVEVPFVLAYVVEWLLCSAGVLLLILGLNSFLLSMLGTIALLLCMQPLMKVSAGLILGVRYSYAYLWYVEPRFKMRYGTYLTLEGAGKVILHLAGSVGTPIALVLAYLLVGEDQTLVRQGCLYLFWAMVLMQLLTFLAEWVGVKRVGPFRLSLLTSPATAAMELKKLL